MFVCGVRADMFVYIDAMFHSMFLFRLIRYFVTAERFNATRAQAIGLLHEVVETPEEVCVIALRSIVNSIVNSP
jgi:enoyl-CoA hydratase/carnithine racemase